MWKGQNELLFCFWCHAVSMRTISKTTSVSNLRCFTKWVLLFLLVFSFPSSPSPPSPFFVSFFFSVSFLSFFLSSFRPWDTLACCWDVKQLTNKSFFLSLLISIFWLLCLHYLSYFVTYLFFFCFDHCALGTIASRGECYRVFRDICRCPCTFTNSLSWQWHAAIENPRLNTKCRGVKTKH